MRLRLSAAGMLCAFAAYSQSARAGLLKANTAHLSMQHRIDIEEESFGDSTGTLAGL